MSRKIIMILMAAAVTFAGIVPAAAEESDSLSMVSGFAAMNAGTAESERETEGRVVVKTAPEEPTGNKTIMDPDKFLQDIRKANEDRAVESNRYIDSEVAAMTNQEIAEMNKDCADTEIGLYEKYKDAAFDNKNLQYLCELYMKGLRNQFDAYDTWQTDSDITKYNELWDAGYSKRALALVEIVDTYGVDIPDMDGMRKTAESLNDEDEAAQTDLDYEAVLRAQDDLNTLGFVNTADGNYDQRTSELLHRFQVMYGYEPADGLLDQEALDQLEEEAAKVLPAQTETGTEAAS